MGFSFIPKEMKFFDSYDKLAVTITKAARAFKDLLEKNKFDDEGINLMRDIEHEGDDITHELIDMLNRTFITPFDREDIHSLAHETDDVVDMLFTIAKRIKLYRLDAANEEMVKFIEVIEESINNLSNALKGLRNQKETKPILDACIEINRLENKGDFLRDTAIGKLFENNSDPLFIIKWKEIYEALETVLDICEDVANVIENIMVKQA